MAEPFPDFRDLLQVEGRDIPVLGREDLLAAKRAAGRPKDLIDIDAIENAEQ